MEQIKLKRKLPVWKKASIIILTFLVTLGIIWAVLTDIIVLRRTEDMNGSENAISILFVANSQVFVGDVPEQLQTIASTYDVEIKYKDLSRHGLSLRDSMDNAIIEIQSRKFDYVVLYDHSMRPQNDIEGFFSDIQLLCNEARENDVIPVLYNAAWASIDGQPNENYQNISTDAYKKAANENDAILVNAGDAWAYAYQTIPGISLYSRFDPRGPHANKAGGFLTACVFAATLFDLHIEDIPKDNLYKGDDAIDLAQAAWEFVHPSH